MKLFNSRKYAVQQGFTLVELMIVVAIIGILAAIAYPLYTESVRKGNRKDMQTEMLQIAQQLETWKLTHYTYSGFTALPAQYPLTGTALYGLAVVSTDSDWTMTATALATSGTPPKATIQTGDGDMILNSDGQRCWTNTKIPPLASQCTTPSATTNWDGR